MKRVYFASKLVHGKRWRELNEPGIFAHARWLRHNAMGTPDDSRFAEEFWFEDHEDVITADAVVVYAEEGEHLKGALVEAGMALAAGIPVYVIGSHPDYGTWRYHSGVKRALTLEKAFVLIRNQPRKALT